VSNKTREINKERVVYPSQYKTATHTFHLVLDVGEQRSKFLYLNSLPSEASLTPRNKKIMTFGHFLPEPVEKMLSDFTAQNFPLKWNISNDGFNVSLNLSWKLHDQRLGDVRSLHIKSPAMRRRDENRMTTFLEKKDKARPEVHLSPQGQPSQASNVSDFVCTISPTDSKTIGPQTTEIKSPTSTAITQTDILERKDVGTICDMKTDVCNANSQTDAVQCQSMGTQTKTAVEDSDKICSDVRAKSPVVQRNDPMSKNRLPHNIENIVRTRVNGQGQKEALVKFRHYPTTYNRWVNYDILCSARPSTSLDFTIPVDKHSKPYINPLMSVYVENIEKLPRY
jgi:hypothetical protein